VQTVLSPPRTTLTHLEIKALRGGLNVSDGHPRMPLTAAQERIVAGLADLFHEALRRPFEEVEEQAQRAFLHGIGQRSAPIGTGRLVSCYSSSTAMDIVARTLAGRFSTVALVHPTFDNIADLLRARGLTLVPVAEHELDGERPPQLPPEVGAVFVTTPNNPTGWVLPADALARLAESCARAGRVLAMDTCFRPQDPRAQYDTYEILDESGVEWVLIEDTGKVWPMLELKAGFLAWGERTDLPLLDAFSDVLLSISPMVLLLVQRLAEDGAAGGYRELHRLLAGNRALLADILADSPLMVADPDSRISVARITWDSAGPDAHSVYEDLARQGLNTLPCGPFHWARPEEGRRLLRVALARGSADVSAAARLLGETARRWGLPRRPIGRRDGLPAPPGSDS
jgi:enduracididine biosynthesis enzyme MppP